MDVITTTQIPPFVMSFFFPLYSKGGCHTEYDRLRFAGFDDRQTKPAKSLLSGKAQNSGKHGTSNEIARIPKTSSCNHEGKIINLLINSAVAFKNVLFLLHCLLKFYRW